jgi:hypothetical protein
MATTHTHTDTHTRKHTYARAQAQITSPQPAVILAAYSLVGATLVAERNRLERGG